MTSQQKIQLYSRLLEITAENRFTLMKEIWNLCPAPASTYHTTCRELISRSLTRVRNDIFTIITSDLPYSNHLVREIIEDDCMPLVKKNIAIMSTYKIDSKCIALTNSINVGYVRMCIRALKREYPELFR